jgi:hypothetical protein
VWFVVMTLLVVAPALALLGLRWSRQPGGGAARATP